MRISDWSSDVCSSDLNPGPSAYAACQELLHLVVKGNPLHRCPFPGVGAPPVGRPFFQFFNALRRHERHEHMLAVPVRCADQPLHAALSQERLDRKSVVQGKSVSVRVDLGGRRIIKKKKKKYIHRYTLTITT